MVISEEDQLNSDELEEEKEEEKEERECDCEPKILLVDDNEFNIIPLQLIIEGHFGVACERAISGCKLSTNSSNTLILVLVKTDLFNSC